MMMRNKKLFCILVFLAGAFVFASSFVQSGFAVYYPGRPDHETKMTAAHRTLAKGTWVRVIHLRTGKSIVVKINDRGPWDDRKRIIDLSKFAAKKLGILREGIAPVKLVLVTGPK